ncbi:glycosyltransferase [Spirosoma soli]|uniref:Glycosyltransferase n=1 Tax=Spirosoma soli TaxID=1770529 RepID=A0ABW5M3Z9_9BACT
MPDQIKNIIADQSSLTSSALKQSSASAQNVDFVSKILFLIVLYKTDLNESPAFQSLKKTVRPFLSQGYVDVLICDNSPSLEIDDFGQIDNEEFNLYYLHDPANPGISLSYNRGAEIASLKGKEWMLVLDQDTTMQTDSLQKYVDALKNYPNFPVYAPMLYSNNLLLSPCKYIMNRGTHLAKIEPGVHFLKARNVLNSGLLISIDAYQNVGGYDENVWLYFSDFVFFDRLKVLYKKFVVVDCLIEHQLSSSDYTNAKFALNRFTYYCQGAKAASLSNGELKSYLGYTIMVGLRSILMSYRFKSISFFKVFIKAFSLGKNEN